MKLRLIMILFLLAGFSSCGVISKARYGNGFSINFETNWGREDGKNNHKVSSKKKKVIRDTLIRPALPSVASNQEPEDSTEFIQTIASHQDIRKPSVFLKKKLRQGFKQLTSPVSFKKPVNQDGDSSEKPEMDKASKAAGFVFYGSLFLAYWSLIFLEIEGLLGIFLIFMLLGFILAMAGMSNIQNSEYPLSGFGLDLSIIILFALVAFVFILVVFSL